MEKVILKECSVHGMTEYVLRNDGRYRCRKCAADSVRRKRYRLKEKAVEYKGGKCEICGYDKCIDALEFHHLDSSKKDFGISSGETRKWNKIKNELDKCIMVCSNCHRELHAKDNENVKTRVMSSGKKITTYDEYIDRIIDLRDNKHMFINDIAKELGISRVSVMKYYKRKKNKVV